MKILEKLNVKTALLGDETKSHTLTFINKGIWNIHQMNLMSTDLDFITFVWAFMIMYANTPNESMNYNVCLLYITDFNYALLYLFINLNNNYDNSEN